MRHLTYRSLLLSTIISMGHIVYGAGIESNGKDEEPSSSESSCQSVQGSEDQSVPTDQESKVASDGREESNRPDEGLFVKIVTEIGKNLDFDVEGVPTAEEFEGLVAVGKDIVSRFKK